MMKSSAASRTRRSSSSICASISCCRDVRHDRPRRCRPRADRGGGDQCSTGPTVSRPANDGRPSSRMARYTSAASASQQLGGKEVIARGEQPRAVEDVDVLPDDAAQPDDDVVVDDRQRRQPAHLEAAEVLDDAAGHHGGGWPPSRCRPASATRSRCGRRRPARPQAPRPPPRKPGTASVETADLAQQRGPTGVRAATVPKTKAPHRRQEGHEPQRHQLGHHDEVTEPVSARVPST